MCIRGGNVHRFKCYGQNKIYSEIMAIFLYFCPKLTTLQEALVEPAIQRQDEVGLVVF